MKDVVKLLTLVFVPTLIVGYAYKKGYKAAEKHCEDKIDILRQTVEECCNSKESES